MLEIWVSCPDAAVAARIADDLVARRLAACANILDGVASVYRWRGAVAREREALLVLKTRQSLFDAVAARTRALHPYEVPAIIALPVVRVNDDYRDWVYAETENPAPDMG